MNCKKTEPAMETYHEKALDAMRRLQLEADRLRELGDKIEGNDDLRGEVCSDNRPVTTNLRYFLENAYININDLAEQIQIERQRIDDLLYRE